MIAKKYCSRLNRTRSCFYSTKTEKQTKSKYSGTLLLPHTKFPLRLDNNKLTNRDESITKSAGFEQLYEWQRENLDSADEFVLHDGPPYANGPLHMGHAINKILKDVILRRNVVGHKMVHYVPGWDCHGLPIELKACKESLSAIETRQNARNFAEQTVVQHKKMFRSWGILGDWNNCYRTNDSSYVQNQLKQFYQLYELGLVYRDVKPVYWSPSSRTALAEAELIYNETHKSVATTIRLQFAEVPDQLKSITRDVNVYALIWTTTPWTLPANQAICFNPNVSYSLVKSAADGILYVAATKRVSHLNDCLNCDLQVLKSFSGTILNGAKYFHPLETNVVLPFLAGTHVNETKGTGLVHTAPSHGPDDFLVALENNIVIKCLVDETGRYNSDTISKLQGLDVLSEGTPAVVDLIKSDVLRVEEFVHSYPYDWRTDKPVIIRASKQWFIDTDAIKDEAIQLLGNVRVVPERQSEIYKNSLIKQLLNRPYWCISRQRIWGVPIPVFYNKKTEKALINRELIDHLCNLFALCGPDIWWTAPLEKLILPEMLKSNNLSIEDVSKSGDIFDIWLDSGLTWSAVLEKEQTANMYLEGVDQFTGWFQSSLLTSVALRHKAPYKTLFVHGFVVDENGRKMSKSLGNVINPQDIIKGSRKNKPYGIDTLRWWTTCHANQKSTAFVSYNILQSSADDVQKIRSVLRFALSCLSDFKNEPVDYDSIEVVDKYLLHLLCQFQNEVTQYYNEYHFNKVCSSVINFATNAVSALYFTTIKDRLYCDPANSSNRKSAQFVLAQIFDCISYVIAPIVPHLVEELHFYREHKDAETFFKRKPYEVDGLWNNDTVAETMEFVLDIKRDLNKLYPIALDLNVIINASPTLYKLLEIFGFKEQYNILQLSDILQVAMVTIKNDISLTGTNYSLHITKSSCFLCERCRKYTSPAGDKICERCTDVLTN